MKLFYLSRCSGFTPVWKIWRNKLVYMDGDLVISNIACGLCFDLRRDYEACRFVGVPQPIRLVYGLLHRKLGGVLGYTLKKLSQELMAGGICLDSTAYVWLKSILSRGSVFSTGLSMVVYIGGLYKNSNLLQLNWRYPPRFFVLCMKRLIRAKCCLLKRVSWMCQSLHLHWCKYLVFQKLFVSDYEWKDTVTNL